MKTKSSETRLLLLLNDALYYLRELQEYVQDGSLDDLIASVEKEVA
jgi:hypothetical protein